MQQLTSTQIEGIVGGNLATGWVPRNWPGIASLSDLQITSNGVGVRIPGLLAPSVQLIQPIFSQSVLLPGFWEC